MHSLGYLRNKNHRENDQEILQKSLQKLIHAEQLNYLQAYNIIYYNMKNPFLMSIIIRFIICNVITNWSI